MLFGIDISNYQAGIDLARVRAEGFDFCFVKSTEGAGYVSPAFSAQLAGAQGAGLIACAYHYVTGDSAANQLNNILHTVPAGLPVILDVENGAGPMGLVYALRDGLQAAGHRVPLLYLPQWYWSQNGAPALAGMPPLWSSKYPTTQAGYASALYANVPASYWNGYGGLNVVVLQFADSARVAGQIVDASAFGGTRDELNALLYPPPPRPKTSEEDDDMETIKVTDNHQVRHFETGTASAVYAAEWYVVSVGWGALKSVRVWCGNADGSFAGVDKSFDLGQNCAVAVAMPANAGGNCNIEWDSAKSDASALVNIRRVSQPK